MARPIWMRRMRFWGNVAITANPEKCWLWLGGRNPKGYGYTRKFVNGKNINLAHRVSYYLSFGVDPGELLVCHKCDNPSCVNPNHLFLGTNAENQADRREKVNRGALPPTAITGTKLSVPDVQQIKRRLANQEPCLSIAADYAVSYSLIYMIRSGTCWSHVEAIEGVAR